MSWEGDIEWRPLEKYWSYCNQCRKYTYNAHDTREHHIRVHGKGRDFVNMWWADEEVPNAA